MLLSAAAVLSVLAFGLISQQRFETGRHVTETRLQYARVVAEQLSAAEWQAIAEGRLRTAAYRDARAKMGELVAVTSSIKPDGGLAAQERRELVGSVGVYLRSMRLEFSALRTGLRSQARLIDVVQVDPAFNRVSDDLVALTSSYRAAADRRRTLTDRASVAGLVIGVALIALLLIMFVRARGRATEIEQRTLTASDERFRALIANSSDIIIVVDVDTTIAADATSAERRLGYPAGKLHGVRLDSLIHPDETQVAQDMLTTMRDDETREQTAHWRLRRHDGSWLEGEVAINNRLDDERLAGFILNVRDVSDQKALEARLEHQAFHDALTGLANRSLLADRLAHALERTARRPATVGVVVLDLDGFKEVNDTLGHAAGDGLLVATAARLSEVLRPSDTLARTGGDEFVILLEDMNDESEGGQVVERLRVALHAPLSIAGVDHAIRPSIGIAFAGDSAGNPATRADDLMRHADLAMYAAKRDGGDRWKAFMPEMEDNLRHTVNVKRELSEALATGQLELHYQPIVSIAGNEVVGLEALARWRHPERGLLLPCDFIPVAEETGLIVPLGSWALHEACHRVAGWQRTGSDSLYVSVNVAGGQLQRPDFVDDVADALSESGIEPGTLILEVTETALIQDTPGSARKLAQLRALGVKLALDDFGTGYSSLTYLRNFAMDILKIDKSFIDTVAVSARESSLVETMVKMGSTLGMQVVAEGIEDADQLARLRTLDCELGQGYLFSRPVPRDEIDRLLASDLDVEARVEPAAA